MPIALLLLLGSCGGDSKSSKQTVSANGATGASGPTAANGSGGALAPKAADPKSKKKASSGAKSTPTSKKAANQNPKSAGASPTAPSQNAGLEALKKHAEQLQKQLHKGSKKKSGSKKQGGNAPPPPSKQGGKPQDVFAAKAKRVCAELGIGVLARRYNVAPNAEAVATAYAASYPATFRAAVHDGCKSAFPGH